jgi:hypothetical protein
VMKNSVGLHTGRSIRHEMAEQAYRLFSERLRS